MAAAHSTMGMRFYLRVEMFLHFSKEIKSSREQSFSVCLLKAYLACPFTIVIHSILYQYRILSLPQEDCTVLTLICASTLLQYVRVSVVRNANRQVIAIVRIHRILCSR